MIRYVIPAGWLWGQHGWLYKMGVVDIAGFPHHSPSAAPHQAADQEAAVSIWWVGLPHLSHPGFWDPGWAGLKMTGRGTMVRSDVC